MNEKPLLFTVAFSFAQFHYIFKLFWLIDIQPSCKLPELSMVDEPVAS